jgi:hypothetical protein
LPSQNTRQWRPGARRRRSECTLNKVQLEPLQERYRLFSCTRDLQVQLAVGVKRVVHRELEALDEELEALDEKLELDV